MAPRPLTELVDPSWAPVLEPQADTIAAIGDFLRAENAAGRGYLPAGENVLRAFRTPLDAVRVLIVGQDPYPTPGHPVGLSFSVAPDVRPLPKSLVNIFTEYQSDLGLPPPSNGDLSAWAERGVLLLNRVLTVQPRASRSHRGKGWEQVTEAAIRGLGRSWWTSGRGAVGSRRAGAGPDARGTSHRSPAHTRARYSASRGFFGSRPFSRVNDALRAAGTTPIDWSLA